VDEFIDIFDNCKPHDHINKKLLLLIFEWVQSPPLDQAPVNVNYRPRNSLKALSGLFQAAKRKARSYSTMRMVTFPIAGMLAFLKINRHAGIQPT